MLTRFHEDCTLPSGPRLYLRENQSGGFRDLCTPSVSETIRFEAAQAVFTNEWLKSEPPCGCLSIRWTGRFCTI